MDFYEALALLGGMIAVILTGAFALRRWKGRQAASRDAVDPEEFVDHDWNLPGRRKE